MKNIIIKQFYKYIQFVKQKDLIFIKNILIYSRVKLFTNNFFYIKSKNS